MFNMYRVNMFIHKYIVYLYLYSIDKYVYMTNGVRLGGY